ncbi:uncharacterized protein EAE97_006443 [Botrytis byssoidea]|uniref:C2H2-type domain-containing protein n=1 Tax=Botrytis byssoidea TaxID=139641 RepID=A0A9P5IP64_9HELO|nr:uncharacterized protein EAE97_006443 [Botrytis byssoidea]KAF7941606.1 hypothetical protein EAE97_006443 [Botrytis byssoidea]
MSFRTVEESVAVYESALPQQGYRDPGSNLAQPPICGDQVLHFLENDLDNANHLSYNNFHDNNIDNWNIFPNGELPSYDLEFGDDFFAGLNEVDELVSKPTAGSSDKESPLQCQITPQRLSSSQPVDESSIAGIKNRSLDLPGQVEYIQFEMPEPGQMPISSQRTQTLSKAGTISGSDLEYHGLETHGSNSTIRTNRAPSVFSVSSKRPSDYGGSTSVGSSSSKRRKPSSDKYNCHYDNCNSIVGLKGIGPHNKIHNPYEFFACIVPDCSEIFLRKDTMDSHLKTKSH